MKKIAIINQKGGSGHNMQSKTEAIEARGSQAPLIR
jgi:hypothetical protein